VAIKATPTEFARDINKRMRELPRSIRRSLVAGAHRGRALLSKRTPTDLGQMRNSWRVVVTKDNQNIILINDAPHAGIIEEGARPHNVNFEGRLAIERWAMRQLGVDRKIAAAVTEGIVNKLQRHGQKGHYIVRDALPTMRLLAKKEVERRLKVQAKKRMP